MAIRNENVKNLIAEINVINNRIYTITNEALLLIGNNSAFNIVEQNKNLMKEETELEKKYKDSYEQLSDNNKLTTLYLEKFNFLKNEYFVNYETINADKFSVHVNTVSKFNKNIQATIFNKDLTFKSVLTNENIEFSAEILPQYSRGILEVPEKYDTSIDITLKTYLSKNELIKNFSDLITEIYKNKYIKTPIEFYEEQFFEYKKNKSYPVKIKGIKLADWFFIYDFYKFKKTIENISDRDIFNEVDGLLLDYDETNKKEIYASDSFYKNEKIKLISLIEKAQYKNLLIGIVN